MLLGPQSSVALPAPSTRSRPLLFTDVEMLAPLGDGAQARVYKGRCKGSGRLCATKVSHPKPVCVALLEEEATILQRLDHPHIAKLLGSGRCPHGPFLAMELCHGGDMFDVLSREKRLSERAASRVMRQLLEAVAHMHSRGICHRDLKEENLLVAKPGPVEELIVKVCDFGISQRIDGPSRAGLCTPNYAAPEVLAGEEGGKPGDLWSCGVILYSLLCGCVPFDGQSRAEVLEMVRSEGPSFHEAAWSDVSDEAVGLIRRLLRTEGDKRYTAEQALAHPWVARQAPPGSVAKATEHLLAEQPTPAQAALLVNTLEAFEGAILPWELSGVFRRAGIQADVIAMSQLAAEASYGNGLVDCSVLLGLHSKGLVLPTLLGAQSFGWDMLQFEKLGGVVDFMYSSPTGQHGRVQRKGICA